MNPEIKALLEKAEAKYNEGKAIGDVAVEEKRKLTGEEHAKVKDLWEESLSLKHQADEMQKLDGMSNELDGYFNDPVHKHPVGDGETKDKVTEPTPDMVIERKAFDNWLRRGKEAPPEEKKALTRLTDPAGGYLCPPDIQSKIIVKRDQATFIRPLCEVITTSKDKVIYPAWDDDWDMNMMGETEAFTEETDDTVAGELTLTPHKAGRVLKVSQELLEDQDFNLETKIAERFGYKLGLLQEQKWIKGTGVSQPEGFLVAGITGHDISTATSGVIVPKDVQAFPYRLAAQYRTPSCRWIIPNVTMLQLILLRSNADGADTGNFLWQPSWQAGTPPTLAGFGFIEVPDANWAALTADGHPLLAFGDLSAYIICDRVGFTIQRLVELYAANDYVGFKVRARFDGKLSDVNAIIRLNRT